MHEMSKIQMVGATILVVFVIWTLYGVYMSMAVSEPPYEVLESFENDVEIREYSDQIWAVTLSESQNQGFGQLFNYISGSNEDEKKIEMTAPVVTGKEDGKGFMAFVMPEGFDLDGAPQPLDDQVNIELINKRTMAVITFSGYANEVSRMKHLDILKDTLETHGIETRGDPLFMQYNDPWTPPFLRRNEVGLMVV